MLFYQYQHQYRTEREAGADAGAGATFLVAGAAAASSRAGIAAGRLRRLVSMRWTVILSIELGLLEVLWRSATPRRFDGDEHADECSAA